MGGIPHSGKPPYGKWMKIGVYCIRIYMNLLTHGKSGKINDFKDIF